MENELRNYELGYHITMNVDEGRAPQVQSELEKLITDAGGTITFSQAPERRRLSYSIKHQRQAFFGWMQFSLAVPDPDEDEAIHSLEAMDEYLRLHQDILRYVILRLEHEEDKRTAPLAASRERKAAQETALPKKTEEKKAEDTGKMEKELEEVIGNL